MRYFICLVLVAVGFFSESFGIQGLGGSSPLALIVVRHAVAVAFWLVALVFFLLIKSRHYRLRAIIFYCFLIAAFFPVIGPVGALIMLILCGLMSLTRHKSSDDDFDEEFFSEDGEVGANYGRGAMGAAVGPRMPAFKLPVPLVSPEKIQKGPNPKKSSHPKKVQSFKKYPIHDGRYADPDLCSHETSLESFADIILGQKTQMKIRVIEKLANSQDQRSITLLKTALRDPVAEVRLYAASILLKVESGLNEKMLQAQADARIQGTVMAHRKLADLYRVAATSGFNDGIVANHYLELAAENYQMAISAGEDDPQTFVKYSQCLMELNRFDRSKSVLELAELRWPDYLEFRFLIGEQYFRQGQYQLLKDHLQGLPASEGMSDEQKRAKEFWCQKT